MANVKISNLTAATTPLAGTEVLPIVQSGATVKASIANVQTAVYPGGTANGVAYLNGSKVLTTGSALVFDGTNLGVGVTPSAWGSRKALEVGNAGSAFFSVGANQNYLTSNSYFDGAFKYGATGTATAYQQFAGTHAWLNATSGSAGGVITFTQAMTLDASGNLGLGVTPNPLWGSSSAIDITAWTAIGTIPGNGSTVITNNAYYNSSGVPKYKISTFNAAAYSQSIGGVHTWSTAPSGTAGNTISFTQAMTLDASGNLLVGTTSGSYHKIYKNVTSNGQILGVGPTGDSFRFYQCDAGGANAAATAFSLDKWSATGRSINAGGTINASGADYAEYMTKAGDFTIAKGDVVGIDAQGKLTNVFADSVSFMVKSTDPSYVGGDSWGSEEALGLIKPESDASQEDKDAFDAALEAARQRVDRIAFAGQVPVNVMGATAGQYIIPVNDNGAIKGEAVSNPTFEQYQTAVGKVIAIESDGRAKIIVKVA
jgi:hypothetical protein